MAEVRCLSVNYYFFLYKLVCSLWAYCSFNTCIYSFLGQHMCLCHPKSWICGYQVSASSEGLLLLMILMIAEYPVGESPLKNPSCYCSLTLLWMSVSTTGWGKDFIWFGVEETISRTASHTCCLWWMSNNFPFTSYNICPPSQDVLVVQMRVTSVAVDMT